jgi:hypothetical protein
MKKLTLFLSLSVCSLSSRSNAADRVNPVLGNISYINKFGVAPDESTDEKLRISTHLEYVEQLLRSKDVSWMPEKQQEKRRQMLQLLNEYRNKGIYPDNFDYPGQRLPCFIDDEGKICAVGYLVQQSWGPKAANLINGRYQYRKISEMDLELLKPWMEYSGLSLEECAMIQPTYAWRQIKVPKAVIGVKMVTGVIGGKISGGLSGIDYDYKLSAYSYKNLPALSGQAGIYYRHGIGKKKKSYLGAELLYVSVRTHERLKSQVLDEFGNPTGKFLEVENRRNLNYIGLPFYYGYTIKKFSFNLGFQINALLSANAAYTMKTPLNSGETTTATYRSKPYMEGFDYGPRVGITYPLPAGFSIEANFYYGMNDIMSIRPDAFTWYWTDVHPNAYTRPWRVRQLNLGLRYNIHTFVKTSGAF